MGSTSTFAQTVCTSWAAKVAATTEADNLIEAGNAGPSRDLPKSVIKSLRKCHAVEVWTGVSREWLICQVYEKCGFAPLHISRLGRGTKLMTFQTKAQKEKVLGTDLTTKTEDLTINDIGSEIGKYLVQDIPQL